MSSVVALLSPPIVEKKKKIKKKKPAVPGTAVAVASVAPKKAKKTKTKTTVLKVLKSPAGKPKVKKTKAKVTAAAAGTVIKKAKKKPAASPSGIGGMTSSGTGPGSIRDFKLYRDGKVVMAVGEMAWKQSYSIGKSGLKVDGEKAFPFQPGDRWSVGVLNCPTSVLSFRP